MFMMKNVVQSPKLGFTKSSMKDLRRACRTYEKGTSTEADVLSSSQQDSEIVVDPPSSPVVPTARMRKSEQRAFSWPQFNALPAGTMLAYPPLPTPSPASH